MRPRGSPYVGSNPTWNVSFWFENGGGAVSSRFLMPSVSATFLNPL